MHATSSSHGNLTQPERLAASPDAFGGRHARYISALYSARQEENVAPFAAIYGALDRGTESRDMGALGEAIRAARKQAGFRSQAALAARLGVHLVTVTNWERGRRRPSDANLAELAMVLGLSVDGLLALRAQDAAQSDAVIETAGRADVPVTSSGSEPHSPPDATGTMPYDPHAAALANLFLSIPPEHRRAAYEAIQSDIVRWSRRRSHAREGTTDGD